MSTPQISIVISTDGRAASLAATLASLEFLEYPAFEVCVITGPTEDGTPEVLGRHAGQIKTARIAERNIARSRNIGIALARGQIVAFLDDDAIPEPEWLHDLAKPYADPAVGAAGGFVYDHTGTRFQCRYATADRLGRADHRWQGPVPDFCFPYSANYPHLQGANCSFRRDLLLELGGFDEEFEYHLDETDLCCRVVDAGWRIAQIDGAYVHHKAAPSIRRNHHRVVRSWYSLVKNTVYFSLQQRPVHHTLDDVVGAVRDYVNELRHHLEWSISHGFLGEDDRLRCQQEVDRGWEDGLLRGLSQHRRLMDPGLIAQHRAPFRPFPTNRPETGRRCFVFVSRMYPPGPLGGVARYTHHLARRIAAMGHQVHVVTSGEHHDRLDFEEGVWVHRLPDQTDQTAPDRLPSGVPAEIWNHAETVADAVDGIAAKRPVDAVCASIWDCEGIAILRRKRHKLVTVLVTTLKSWLETNRHGKAEPEFLDRYVRPMLALERELCTESQGVVAISRAIAAQIERDYGMQFGPERLAYVPLGLEDWRGEASEPPPGLPAGRVRLLFVGRLEARKGIDILLQAARKVLPRYPEAHLDIVGNDTIPGPGGQTWRAWFEADPEAGAIRSRVTFHGEVADARLRGFYRACDVLVTPSRFESFGLMLIEGMMFGKPVIGCLAGGMVEVVADGISGFLAQPGSADSLAGCLERLIVDPGLRVRMGAAGRARYEALFHPARMAEAFVEFLSRIAGRPQTSPADAHLEREITA